MLLKTTIASILLAGVFSREAVAQAPPQLSYQGYITDAGGVPVERTVQLSLRVYDASNATESIWSEVHENVPVDRGLFEVRLGSVTPLDLEDDALAAALSSGDLYLGVQVDDDVEMEPRQRLLAVPWAWRANFAEEARTVNGRRVDELAPVSHTHEGWDVVSEVAECAEASALVCEGCVTTVEVEDGSLTLADLARSGCAEGQLVRWNGTAWECSADQLAEEYVTGDAYVDRFLGLTGGMLSGPLALAPEAGPAELTLAGVGAGGEAVVSLAGAGGLWQIVGEDEANALRIFGSGVARVTVDALGRVGIGTSAPQQTLHVVGDGVLLDNGAGQAAFWRPDNAGLALALTNGVNYSYGELQVRNTIGDAVNLFVGDGGYVGIGTAAPAARLDIQDDSETSLVVNSSAVQSAFRIGPDANTQIYRTNTENILKLLSATAVQVVNGGGVPRVTFESGGNVGIGTTSPQRVLQIQGGDGVEQVIRNIGTTPGSQSWGIQAFQGNLNFRLLDDGVTAEVGAGKMMSLARSGNVGIGRTNPTATLHVSGTATDYIPFRLNNTAAGGGDWQISMPALGSGGVAGSLIVGEQSGANNVLTITRAGNVGIGTVNPAHTLDVVGPGGLLLDDTSGRGLIWRPDGAGIAFLLSNGVNQSYGVFQARNALGNVANLVVNDVGYVGLGTNGSVASNTGARLVVNGAIESSGQGDAPTAYLALLPSSGNGAAARIQTGGTAPATDIVLAPAGAEAFRVTTSAGTQVQGNLYVNDAGGMDGGITAAGHIYAHSTLKLGDLAEDFPLSPGETAEAGDVLVIDPEHPGKLRRSSTAYDAKVVGIVSEQPTFRIGVKGGGVPVALVGRAQVKVVGLVQVGDFLVASDVPGVAMHAAEAGLGGILGTAMAEFAGGPGELGTVVAFVHLQSAPSVPDKHMAVLTQEVRVLRERVVRLESSREPTAHQASSLWPGPAWSLLALVGVGVMLGARGRLSRGERWKS